MRDAFPVEIINVMQKTRMVIKKGLVEMQMLSQPKHDKVWETTLQYKFRALGYAES